MSFFFKKKETCHRHHYSVLLLSFPHSFAYINVVATAGRQARHLGERGHGFAGNVRHVSLVDHLLHKLLQLVLDSLSIFGLLVHRLEELQTHRLEHLLIRLGLLAL